MRRYATMITAAATLGLATLAYAQTSPEQSMPPEHSSQPSSENVSPGQPVPESESASPANPTESSNPTQASRFAALVPSDMSATEACDGFKSMTECAAALHAAKNAGIPFKDLKTKMTGGEKLGAAIHDLKPSADVQSEVSRAEEQAKADVRAPQG